MDSADIPHQLLHEYTLVVEISPQRYIVRKKLQCSFKKNEINIPASATVQIYALTHLS